MSTRKRTINKNTQMIAILFFGIITVWDTFTTITGTYSILGGGEITNIPDSNKLLLTISVIFAVMITAYLASSIPILRDKESDLISFGKKFLWFLALCYDLYTSYRGNESFIMANGMGGGLEQIVTTIGMSIFVTSSPIAISHLLYDYDPI